jgi:hypothetical protein
VWRGRRENKTEKKEPQGTRTKIAGWRAKNWKLKRHIYTRNRSRVQQPKQDAMAPHHSI